METTLTRREILDELAIARHAMRVVLDAGGDISIVRQYARTLRESQLALDAIERSITEQFGRERVCVFRPRMVCDKEQECLELLEQEAPLTRLQIAARLELAPSTSRILMLRLEERGLVRATEQKRAKASGRRPFLYRLAPGVKARRRRERSR